MRSWVWGGRMDELGSSRFQLLRKLGSGGMGVVYEAYDHETDGVVAIKTLKQFDGDALYRFKHEFRALADIQHPNLIRFGELHCEGGQWFFTMELVRGKSFLAYVRGDRASELLESSDDTQPTVDVGPSRERAKPAVIPSASTLGGEPAVDAKEQEGGGGFDEPRLRDAARQLALAIQALHRGGRVHRDVKPSNVLVRADGHVVLLDFGLIDDLGPRVRDRFDRQVVGTPVFMAPEQSDGERVGPEADWYAFGVLLFVGLVGKLPFCGPPDELFTAKRTQASPSPRALCPELPADLDALCRALLEPDPTQRPRGDEILRRLDADGASEPPSSHPTGELASAVFVGRADELAALGEAFDVCRAGQRELVLIEGEPGVGKSTLVRRFLEQKVARDRAAVVLAGRCYEQESMPFKAFDPVIDALSRYLAGLPDADVTLLLSSGIHFLASVFPVLERVPAVARQLSSDRRIGNPVALREQAFRELKQLLAAIARRVPLVLFIDDLQWADQDSLALLGTLLADSDGPRGLFVGTSRTGLQPTDAHRALGRELAGVAIRRVALTGLSPDASRSLWRALWASTDPSGGRAPEPPGALLDEAAGHPLFLSEMVRYARAADPQTVPRAHLQDVLTQRFAALDTPARRFMELVALAGTPIAYQVVARAAELDVSDCAHLMGTLRSAQMLRVSRRGTDRLVEPYHDRIREAIVQHLRGDGAAASSPASSLRLRESHLRLGRRLLEHTVDRESPGAAFTILHHLNTALELIDAPDERRQVAELSLIAGRQARRTTAYAAALEHLERGIALLDESHWRTDYELCRSLHAERFEAAYLAGQRERALAHFGALLPRLSSDEERIDLYGSMISLDVSAGRSREAIETAREALALVGERLPRKPTAAAVMTEYLAVRFRQRGRTIADLAALPELRDVAKRCAAKLLVAVAPAAYFVSTELLTVCLLRLANITFRYGVSESSAYGVAGYGIVLSGAFGKHEEAHAFGELALRMQERFPDQRLTSRIYFLNGLYLTGWIRPFADAKKQLRAGLESGLQNGDMVYEAYSAGALSVVTWLESLHLADVQAEAESARVVTTRRREEDMAAVAIAYVRYCGALRGLNEAPDRLSSGESNDEVFRESLAANRPMGLFCYYFLNAQLAYFHGDLARANALFREADRLKAVLFSVPTTVELHLWRVLLAARRYPEASVLSRWTLAWQVGGWVKKLARWGRLCPENFAAQHALAVAEQARMLGRPEAGERFTQAFETAQRHRARKWEALALERGASLHRERGDAPNADTLLARAIDAYRAWGADAKVRQLSALRDVGTGSWVVGG
jgi:predicted ATPase/serine/threonine protein kinase